MVVVGPFVARPGREVWSDVIYTVTFPSGFVATGPENYPQEPTVPPTPLVVLDERRIASRA